MTASAALASLRSLERAALAAGLCAAAAAASAAGAAAATPRSYPFPAPGELRRPSARDALPALFADGLPCSTGCRAPGAVSAWPVRPFGRPHLLRAGLNELREGNLHLGVDIFARDGSPVYALQPGPARILQSQGRDARVQVGRFIYWHIRPRVSEGQLVRPLADVVGTVLPGESHVHLSELVDGRFLNPLRPGGRVLAPWSDRAPPVLGRPRLGAGGRVLIGGFDPQEGARGDARAPVLALAGLAYRLFDARGRRVGPLRWALRGTQHQRPELRRRVYAPGSHAAGATCALRPRPCRPNWVYRLAGGLAPRLGVAQRRVYRLSAYAWDWAGNRSAIDARFVYVGGEPFLSARAAAARAVRAGDGAAAAPPRARGVDGVEGRSRFALRNATSPRLKGSAR